MIAELLFWAEAAGASLALTALLMTLTASVRWPLLRWLLRVLLLILLALPWATMVGLLGIFSHVFHVGRFALVCGLSAWGLLAAGTLATLIALARGTRWPLKRLTLLTALLTLLCGLTAWNLNLSVRGDQALLRGEAGTLAASVAPPRLPDELNSCPLYRRAARILTQRSGDDEDNWRQALGAWENPKDENGDELPFDPADPELRAFLHANADVLELLAQAGRRPGFDSGAPYAVDLLAVQLPDLGRMRAFGRMLELAARSRLAEGNVDAAVAHLDACYALAALTGQEQLLISPLVAGGIDRRAFETLQVLLDHGPLSEPQLQRLTIRPDVDYVATMDSALQMEMAMGLAAFTKQHLSELFGQDNPYCHNFNDRFFLDTPPYRLFVWREDLAAYRRIMAQYLDCARRPAWEAMDQIESQAKAIRQRREGPVASGIIPSFTLASLLIEDDVTHRLSLLAVAMERYRLAHGGYPGDLAALEFEPGFDTRIDPFSGGPFKMTVNAEGRTVLYSVGRDRDDDGGRPVDEESSGPVKDGDILLTLPR